jgi:hypothetical protein
MARMLITAAVFTVCAALLLPQAAAQTEPTRGKIGASEAAQIMEHGSRRAGGFYWYRGRCYFRSPQSGSVFLTSNDLCGL